MQEKSLPRLEIVSTRRLILHEDVEQHRVDKIVDRFQRDRYVKNPPVVGRNADHRRMIVLDGASRVTAARRLGFPHLLVQIVSYPSSEIGLDPWHHLVVGMRFELLLDAARNISGVSVKRVSWSKAAEILEERKAFACLRSPGKTPATLQLSHPRLTGLRPVREFTHLYATDPGLHRVREDQVGFPREWLGDAPVLVLFPRYRQRDILRFALRLRDRLPMGITRHTVPNRALRVFYPVSVLRSSKPILEKQRHLRNFLEDRWEGGRIRHYPEATVLYDE